MQATRKHATPPRLHFRESFFESCGDLAKGRKSKKVAGQGSSLGLQYCAGEQNFAFPGSNTSNSLKNRAARAKKPDQHLQNQDLCPQNAENEDPAKMTHSIHYLLSRARN